MFALHCEFQLPSFYQHNPCRITFNLPLIISIHISLNINHNTDNNHAAFFFLRSSAVVSLAPCFLPNPPADGLALALHPTSSPLAMQKKTTRPFPEPHLQIRSLILMPIGPTRTHEHSPCQKKRRPDGFHVRRQLWLRATCVATWWAATESLREPRFDCTREHHGGIV